MNRLISELMQETELRQPPYETNIKNDPAITNLGIVVLDEIHLIGDSQRYVD
jgi:superfamily II RNA helicase